MNIIDPHDRQVQALWMDQHIVQEYHDLIVDLLLRRSGLNPPEQPLIQKYVRDLLRGQRPTNE